MTTQAERLGRFMFDRQADAYDADPDQRELAWADDNISGFWVAEAEAVMGELGIAECGGCRTPSAGSHRRHCRRNPTWTLAAELADRAEDLGDQIGSNNMGAANLCYAAAGQLRNPRPRAFGPRA